MCGVRRNRIHILRSPGGAVVGEAVLQIELVKLAAKGGGD